MSSSLERLTAALADRYNIESELGAGGMATVYLARDVRHNRQVAVKVLRPELAAAIGPERFLREIEIAANLRHPHILPLYDSGEADGFLFYVMPFAEGESLRERLDRERQLPVDDAIRITTEVADALSLAHSQGVVHRDIKPENIMLEAGHAVVADFGIALALASAGAARLTQTGVAVGTPAYMSPEQASGDSELDGRSDLYSLGCVLYEMIAGQPPFTGPTVESLIHQHLTVEAPSIANIRPGVPDAVIGILARALAKTPADRFSPVTQFSDALGRAREVPVTTGVSPVAPRRRALWPVITGAVAIVATAVVVMRGGMGEPATSDGASVAVLPFAAGGNDEYLGDGIAETLMATLSQLEGLQVAARTSAFSFKGQNVDVREIGDRLGVATVLEGSVQRAGNQLRITAQLVNVTDGFQLWSETFNRDMSDVFAVQDEVAGAVASALQLALLADAPSSTDVRGTANLAAYDAYLLGRFHWNKRTSPDVELAARYFNQAIAADSTYAKAWASLAEAYLLFHPSEYEVQTIPWAEAARRGKEAARRALTLDSTSAEAYTALASILEKEKQFDEAARFFRRAIAVRPTYATAHQWYGGLLLSVGELEEGLREFQEAARLDPLSVVMAVEVAEALDALGRTAEATAKFDEVLADHGGSSLVHFFAANHYLILKDFDRVATHFEQVGALFGVGVPPDPLLSDRIRDPTTRAAALRAVADTSRRAGPAIAIYRALDDVDGMIHQLEESLLGPDSMHVYLPAVYMVLGPELSQDERIKAILQRFRGR